MNVYCDLEDLDMALRQFMVLLYDLDLADLTDKIGIQSVSMALAYYHKWKYK